MTDRAQEVNCVLAKTLGSLEAHIAQFRWMNAAGERLDK